MKQQNLVFFGGGGVAIDTANYIREINKNLDEQNVIVISDVVDEGKGRVEDLSALLGYRVNMHNDTTTIENFENKQFVITLGQSPVRYEKYKELKRLGASFYNVIHPKSEVADTAEIGKSCIIGPYSVVSPYATVSDNVLLNVRSTVGHDAVIGESSIVSPHALITGSCVCGTSVFVGAGSVIMPAIKVGNFAKLSAGSIVVSDVPAGHFANGNPAVATRLFNTENGRLLFDTAANKLA